MAKATDQSENAAFAGIHFEQPYAIAAKHVTFPGESLRSRVIHFLVLQILTRTI